ncbi:MAG: LytTR family DNA-binding domain-containing protein [Saprospiraceae bacterium]|nr:LytTR family DNA-binding domain-containing protein [Saprospiraceae bacterium]
MTPQHILLIEDEPTAAERLQKLILELLPSAQIEAVLDSVEDSVRWLKTHKPDLIFMDVQLADGLCFEIFEKVDVATPVVFITAYDDYALKAFRVQALDYLLKPLKRNELEEALGRVQELPPHVNTEQVKAIYAGEPIPDFRHRFLVRLGASIRVVETPDIALIYTESKNTFLMNTEGRRYPLDFSLEALEKQLDPAVFFRANRQYIVALHAIREMYVYSKSRVKVHTEPPAPSEIIVSTEKSASFKRWLAGDDHPDF